MDASFEWLNGELLELKPRPSGRVLQHLKRGFDPLSIPAEVGGLVDDVVAVDMDIVRELGRDTLALDLYLALTYRVFGLRRQRVLTFEALRGQLGADFSEVSARVFKQRLLAALRRVEKLYTDLRVTVTDKGLVLLPSSRTSVPTMAEKGRGPKRESRGVDDVSVEESRPPP